MGKGILNKEMWTAYEANAAWNHGLPKVLCFLLMAICRVGLMASPPTTTHRPSVPACPVLAEVPQLVFLPWSEPFDMLVSLLEPLLPYICWLLVTLQESAPASHSPSHGICASPLPALCSPSTLCDIPENIDPVLFFIYLRIPSISPSVLNKSF